MADGSRLNRIGAILVVVVVATAIGYWVGSARGAATAKENAKRHSEARERVLTDTISEGNDALRACRKVINAASDVIRANANYIDNLYDEMMDNVNYAYELGVAGDAEELHLGLRQAIYYDSLLPHPSEPEDWADTVRLGICMDTSLGLPSWAVPESTPS
jgi:hypothetical protein